MNVGRAALHGVGEQAIDELHDRSVVGQVLFLDVFVFLVLDDLEILFLRFNAPEQALELGVRLLVVALNRVAQRVFAGNDRKDVATRDEFDVFDRRDVVGVGDRDRESAALPL